MANTITIGGATVKNWLETGALNVFADPAGGLLGLTSYDKVKKTNAYIFNANDRDIEVPKDPDFKRPFGIGVYTQEARRQPGLTSKPTEIGYYPALGESDQLIIELAKPLTNSQATVSFFYAEEKFAPEKLSYQAYYKNEPVHTSPIEVTATGNGFFSRSNAGFFTFGLAGDSLGSAKIDKIVFSAVGDPNILDVSDYLLQSISGEGVPQLEITNTSAPDLVWPTRTYTFDYTEKNTGNGDSPAHNTGFFLSTDQLLDESDTLLGSVAEDTLAAGASRSVSQTLTLPDSLAIGNYYLIYQSDVDNVVDEQNESNTANLGNPRYTGAIVAEPIEVNGYVRRNFDLSYGTTTEQSIWAAGDISHERFLGVSWDPREGKASVDVLGTEIGVRGSTSGKIGLQSNLKVEGSKLNNASLPIDLWLDVPNKVQAGDIVTIKSGFTLDPNASFSATGPTASYTLDGIFGLSASAQAFVGGNNTNLLPPISIPETSKNLVSLTLDTNNIAFPIGSYGAVDLHLPNINSSDNASDGVLRNEASDSFFNGSLNASKLIVDVLKGLGVPVPRLEDNIGISFPTFVPGLSGTIKAGYTLLSTTLTSDLSLKQNLAVSPDSLTGQLTLENGDVHNFNVGQDLTFTVPEGIGDSLDFSTNLNLGASITNNTSLGYGVNVAIEALSAYIEGKLEVGYKVWGIGYTKTIFEDKFSIGPLVRGSVDILKRDIPLYIGQFSLGDLGSQSFDYSIPTVV